jgi:hypothetical protein
MTIFRFTIALMTLVSPMLPLHAQDAAQNEVDAIVARFKREFDGLAVKEASAIAPLKSSYIKDLERLRDTAKSKGDLATVLDINAAIEAEQSGNPAPKPKVAATALNAARTTYETHVNDALGLHKPQRQRLEADFIRSLEELQTRFTRSGNMEAAKAARAAKLSIPGVTVDILPDMIGEHVIKENMYVVTSGAGLKTEARFSPPIEITYVFKTEGQFRLGYAADQIIFNWEVNRNELRIDGGPSGGQHRGGAGGIPTKQLITLTQRVLPEEMVILVNGRERARWNRNFRGVNKQIAIWPIGGAPLHIKQLTVCRLPEPEPSSLRPQTTPSLPPSNPSSPASKPSPSTSYFGAPL